MIIIYQERKVAVEAVAYRFTINAFVSNMTLSIEIENVVTVFRVFSLLRSLNCRKPNGQKNSVSHAKTLENKLP